MKLGRTTRWTTAGAALGLSTAVFAGAAFAATPGPSGGVGETLPRSEAPAAALTGAATMTTSTTTTVPGVNAPSSTQAPTETATMMSEMLASLSPQARAELQSLYPQMLRVMASSLMMSGTGTVGSMMGTSVVGNGATSAGQPTTR